MRGRIVWVTTGVGVNLPLKTLPLSLFLKDVQATSLELSALLAPIEALFCNYHLALANMALIWSIL